MNKCKKVFLIIVISIFIVLGISCNKNREKYDIYFYGAANDGLLDSSKINYYSQRLENEDDFQNENAEINKAVNFNGNVYECTYKYSRFDSTLSYFCDIYYTSDGCMFGFKEGTNDLKRASFIKTNFSESELEKEDLEDIEEYGMNLALDIFSKFIDINDYYNGYYKLEITFNEQFSKYSYSLLHYINDIATTDGIRLGISTKGTLCGFVCGDIRAFENYDTSFINEDFLNELKESLESTIKKTYFKCGYNSINVENKDFTLMVSYDKKLVILSEHKVLINKENTIETGEKLITILSN